MQKKLLSYAVDFVSFMLYKIDENSMKKINKIILFGSVARGNATEKSDVDIFIETNDIKIHKKISSITENFYKSNIFKYWKMMGIDNEIKCMIGDPKNWELEESLISDGIVIYGKYQKTPKNKKNMTIFGWEEIKPESKRVIISKKIFGYKHSGKFYEGLLQQCKGEKIGKGVIAVPSEHAKKFLGVFRKEKAKVKIYEMVG